MKILRHPLFLITLGALVGFATGLGWYWRGASAIAARIAQQHARAKEARTTGSPWGFWSIEIENLASELKDERARCKQQADLLDQREARFAAERRELDQVRADLEAQRQAISGRLVEIQASEAKNLRTLAQAYTNLSPQAAVTIFGDLDDVTVVKILSLMKPDTVAPIFEAMTQSGAANPALAKRAAALTEKLRLVQTARSGGA